jgi:hypothetical protein
MTGCRIGLLVAITVLALALGGVAAWAADDSPPVTTEISLEPAVQFRNVDINERRFNQYVTPPSGLFLEEGIWRRFDPSGGLSFDLSLRDLGATTGPGGDLWVDWMGMNLDAQYRRSVYFFDFDPASGRNRRYDYAVGLQSNPGPNRRYSFDVGTSEVAVRGMPSSGLQDWRDHRDRAGFGLNLAGFWLGLNYLREDFSISIPAAISGATQSYGLTLAPRLADRLQFSGYATYHATDLDTYPGEDRRWDAALTAGYPVGESVNLIGEVRHFDVADTITQKSYAHRQTSGSLQAEYRPWSHTTFTALYRNALTDYVDGIQANEVGVESNTYQLGVRSRPIRDWKFTGRYSRHDNSNVPFYYHTDLTLGNSLIYSTLTRWELGATYAPPGPWGASLQYHRRSWENEAQSIDNAMSQVMLTGWWQNDRGNLSLTGSLIRQDFQLPLVDIVTTMGYASDATSAVLGATYLLSPTQSVYGNYTFSRIRGATSNEYSNLMLGYSQEFSPKDRVTAEVNIGDFWDDNDPTNDYSADLWRLSYRRKL